MKKKLLIAAGALASVAAVAVVGVSLLLDANQFRPQLEDALSGALGRKVSIGNIRVALFSGGIAVENLSIADDPEFSSVPFVTAKSVAVGVDVMPLLLSHSLHVDSFRLEQPQVVLRGSSSGRWNFSQLGGSPPSTAATSSAPSTAAMPVMIQKLEIVNGRILVGTRGGHGKERIYEDVNLEVTNLSLTSQFPFRAAAKTPGGGTVTLTGKIGPLSTSDAADTPFEATVDLSRLDIASTGFIDPASGVAGIIDFDGSLASAAGKLTSKGVAKATGIRLVAGGKGAAVPIEIDYESHYNRKAQAGVIKQGDVHIGKAVAHLTGDYNAAGAAVAVQLRLAGDQMPAQELQAVLPAIGITLPSGAALKQGTVAVTLAIGGPVDRLVIVGPIGLSNATVAGFDLGSKLSALPSLAGGLKTGGTDTMIQTLAAVVRIAPEGTRADNMNLVAPAFGTLTGSGVISPKGDLDFRMLAKLTGAASTTQISRIASLGQPSHGIPFRIQGTTANPTFVPDVAHAVSDAASGLVKNPETAKKAAGVLGGLFARQKQ